MIQTINKYDFINAFRQMGRFDQFGYEALEILFDFFEDIEPNMELDVIAICCDYACDDWKTIAQDYNIDLSECDDEEEKEEAVREWLNDRTVLIGETSSGFVYGSAF